MSEFYIIKSTGEKEIFDYGKLENSLRRSGTSEELISEIVQEISNTGHDGMTTKEIYQKAFSMLKKSHTPAAVRFSLKKAVAELGPTGFPFEKFVAEIFKARGYEAITGQIVKGKCVEHEVDVVAWKDDELIMAEAKFHTDFNLKSDLKIALYVKERFDDILGVKHNYGGKTRTLTEGWLVTNTKFSITAAEYGMCQSAFKLVGWNYPYDENLHYYIEKYNLIPVTALTSINKEEKKILIEAGHVLSKDLLDRKTFDDLNFDEEKINHIQNEVKNIIDHSKRFYEKVYGKHR